MGPRDRIGRSLRDLDLQERLLRYPFSYMIYSEAHAILEILRDTKPGLPDYFFQR